MNNTATTDGFKLDLTEIRAKADQAKQSNEAEATRLADSGDVEEVFDRIDLFARLDRGKLAIVRAKLRNRLGRGFGVRDFNAAVKGAQIEANRPRRPGASTQTDSVLTPGTHLDAWDIQQEVGTDDFAAGVLAKLPAGVIYRRGGVPVELVGEPGHRVFEPLSIDRLRLLIDQHVRLGSWIWRGSEEARTATLQYQTCSRDYASLVLAAARTSDHVPEVRLFTRVPVYGCDWRISRPGFHDGVFYDQPPELVGLEPITCRETITATLEDLLVDFPFASHRERDGGDTQANLQTFVGALLTPLIRYAITGNVPMLLVGASKERTGKSKLVEQVLGRMILGQPMPAMQMADDESEIDKRIVSHLLRGSTLLHLDNIRDTIDSPALASLLTATTYGGRVLGSSQAVELPNTMMLAATGNNIVCSGEIAKRVVPVVLQPADDAPELRTNFQHPDLEAYLDEVRPKVLGCLLGIVELWKQSGRPAGKRPMGGFEGWARTVGGAMEVAGFTGWLGHQRAWLRAADPTGSDDRTFVTEWHKRGSPTDYDASRDWSVKQLLELAADLGVYPEVFRSASTHGQIIAFSKRVLRRLQDQPVNGFVVRRKGFGNTGCYRVEGPDDADAAPF